MIFTTKNGPQSLAAARGGALTSGFGDDLTAFLNQNPNCKDLIAALGPGFKKALDNAVNNGISANPGSEILDKTLGELGVKERAAFPQDLNSKLGEVQRLYGASAYSNIDKQEVYYFDLYSKSGSAVIRGSTVFHEALHLYTRGSHMSMLNALKLDLKKQYTPTLTNLRVGKNSKLITEEVPGTYLGDDLSASKSVDDYLSNNCNPSMLRK